MARSKFYEKIKTAKIEREVEDVYNTGITLYFKGVDITHPFGCDGLVDTKTNTGKLLKLIIEYKFDEELKRTTSRAKVVIQVLYYLKQFELGGLVLPNVCLIGDINECFCFHINDVIKYLDEDIDWTIAPSKAAENNPDLILKIANDEAFNPFIFDVDENFSFKTVAEKIIELAEQVQRYVHVTEHNIATIYDYFITHVIKDYKAVQPNDLVAIFLGVITDSDKYYQHPSKKSMLVTPRENIIIDGKAFQSFFAYFKRDYTPQEKQRFAEISDRLIEDTKRRMSGEYYTPTPFVDKAHLMLSDVFGEDWKDEYIVWDNCSGTKNLTRDYRFSHLYSSTLEPGELDISQRYNKEGVAFQFDFLNQPMKELPEELIKAFKEDKPIIIFINPPYGTAGSGAANTEAKAGIAKTKINTMMLGDDIGSCSQNLYAQFLYRIIRIKKVFNLTNIHIGLFSPPLFMTGESWQNFRNLFLDNFKYEKGMYFKASHFADVKPRWGITFTIWSSGKTENKSDFEVATVDIEGTGVVETGTKVLYNLDGKMKASDWVKSEVTSKPVDAPCMTNAINIKNDQNVFGRLVPHAIGYMVSDTNKVNENALGVAMFSGYGCKGHNAGLSIMEDNFFRCMALFAARKLIKAVDGGWLNSKDEYMCPDTENPLYQEFCSDSVIFALFHSSSNQSSLRNITYHNRKWDIKNEFFYMSKEEMMNLANECNNDDCYNDVKTDSERYVYKLLQTLELSTEAAAVLDKARELTRSCFKYRMLFDESHPEYQVNNWDAGWYQVKAILKEFMPSELEAFKEVFDKLQEKMIPNIYNIGFLRP